jgi:hypothetical protein
VTEIRPERPILATLLCIFEAGIVALAIASHFIARLLRDFINAHRADGVSTHTTFILPTHSTPLHLGFLVLTYGLALAIAITLWQMRRSAFYLLAARTGLSCITFVLGVVRWMSGTLPQPHRRMPINPVAIFWIVGILSFCWLVFNVVMTWYVHDITSPKSGPGNVPNDQSYVSP